MTEPALATFSRRLERTLLALMLVVILPAILAGCGAVQTQAHSPAGTPGLQPTQADKDAGLVGIGRGLNLKDYRVIAVERFPVAPEEITTDDDKVLAASMPPFLQSELVRRLRTSGLFDTVVNLSETPFQAGAERTLRLEGTITRLTGGSRALRFWIGFGAGKSEAQIETRFLDMRSGQVVLVTADRRVAAISEALSLDYGGDSEGLLKQSFDNMARDLARFLVRLEQGQAPKSD
jgi:hypothetical protein